MMLRHGGGIGKHGQSMSNNIQETWNFIHSQQKKCSFKHQSTHTQRQELQNFGHQRRQRNYGIKIYTLVLSAERPMFGDGKQEV